MSYALAAVLAVAAAARTGRWFFAIYVVLYGGLALLTFQQERQRLCNAERARQLNAQQL